MRNLWKVILAALVAAFALAAAPASAQATRTWVSGVGDDANPCSRTAPCKTFAGAISKTAAGGEIDCLDSGGFGGVTITKSISIICSGVIGGVLVSGTSGIIVNAGINDRVILKGLDIEGLTNGTSIHGVNVIQARDVIVIDSIIRGFNSATSAGVLVGGSTKMRITVQNSQVISNTVGVSVTNSGGLGSAKVIGTLFVANVDAAVRVATTGNRATLSGNTMIGTKGLELLTGGTAVTFGNNTIDAPSDAATATPLT